ncbi:sporulation protein YyaC [Thermincola ferriacetica]|uniref:Sporulation protein YyaC n=2 Tax=Thermincola TaxID=278993 RepID=D5XCI8_THEPJ|nr:MULTISPECIES: spore protease YyaC [Thermincola]ADG81614.1 sporulation protein YyaC [Thermincola potens JR]KNZ68981.1 sporulation protein YyaC [Thermincola ferriacetica]
MEYKFHYGDKEGQKLMLELLIEMMKGYQEVTILCIGTDRVSGDSLGPLTGTLIKEEYPWARVFGTLDTPVHALNLEEVTRKIKTMHPSALVIAVDACLGRANNVDNIVLCAEPLKPGIGVDKELAPVGDVSVKGIVNVGGFMPTMVLQSTRLNSVYNMAKIIAGTIVQALVAHKNFRNLYKLKEA